MALEAAIVVATLTYVIVASRQLSVMRETLTQQGNLIAQNKDLISAAQRQADAATTAAEATKIQAQVALDTLHSEHRPYVSFGSPDGKFVDYLPPQPGGKKGAIVLHFQNAGNAGASTVLVQGVSMMTPRVTWDTKHLLRYVLEYPKGSYATSGYAEGGDVGTRTAFDVPLAEKWVPTPNQWKTIRDDKWPYGRFSVWGTLEYCDNWGGIIAIALKPITHRPPSTGSFEKVVCLVSLDRQQSTKLRKLTENISFDSFPAASKPMNIIPINHQNSCAVNCRTITSIEKGFVAIDSRAQLRLNCRMNPKQPQNRCFS